MRLIEQPKKKKKKRFDLKYQKYIFDFDRIR